MILKAVFYDGTGGGLISISEKSKKRVTEILSVGETFKGYNLIEIKPQEAIFDKNSKKYNLKLKLDGKLANKVTNINIPNNSQKQLRQNKRYKKNDNIVRVVSKRDIGNYTKDFNSIWKNIGIKEIKEQGKIKSFKVTFVKANSIFEKLGLQRNDIIKAVNNREIKTYKDAFKIYNNINKLESLNIKIIRDGQEKELEYEIF